MPEEEPTIDANSWLAEGNRWIWTPLIIATGVNILASVVIAWVFG